MVPNCYAHGERAVSTRTGRPSSREDVESHSLNQSPTELEMPDPQHTSWSSHANTCGGQTSPLQHSTESIS